jgi:hypothetical protein
MRRRAPSKSAARTARRLAQLVRLSWRGSRTCAREGCRAQPNANEPSSASVQAQRCGGHANSCETYRGETANSPGGRRGNCRCPTARSCRGHASSGSHAARRRRASDGRVPHGGHCSFQKEKESQSRKSAGRAGPSRPCYFLVSPCCGRRRKTVGREPQHGVLLAPILSSSCAIASVFAAFHPHGACKPAPAMACATVAAGSPNEVRGARGTRPTPSGLLAPPHTARGLPACGPLARCSWPAFSGRLVHSHLAHGLLCASDPFARCSWPAFSGRSVHSHAAHGAPPQRSWPTGTRLVAYPCRALGPLAHGSWRILSVPLALSFARGSRPTRIGLGPLARGSWHPLSVLLGTRLMACPLRAFGPLARGSWHTPSVLLTHWHTARGLPAQGVRSTRTRLTASVSLTHSYTARAAHPLRAHARRAHDARCSPAWLAVQSRVARGTTARGSWCPAPFPATQGTTSAGALFGGRPRGATSSASCLPTSQPRAGGWNPATQTPLVDLNGVDGGREILKRWTQRM